ncbi:hypothetical protein LOH54_11610 [Sulfurimonas sp. HSL-3221]|uniref:hypothetical protein n=1 Tax=Sulfurimonadaceae TaxID=2771471 RepID=UPI001E29EB54|nr:hypothetical protein [Sulfurimonas sp. HSL-3221]UFS62284.1 hypothetical protein LOH54_11610 [Sulfurimonas sp. HSL-3221]
MKPLLIAGLILTALFADNALLLPHRWQDARHTLGVMIRSGNTPLLLMTERLDDSYLRQALRQALENDRNVTLITSSRETASRWAMYRSLHACLLPPGTVMTFSLLRTSETGCMVSGTLETETLRSASGLMVCKERKAFNETVRLLQQECRGYFKR